MAASSVPTLSELETFLAANPTPAEVAQRFEYHQLGTLKSQLDPSLNHPSILSLAEAYRAQPTPALGNQILQQTQALQATPEHQQFRQIFNALFRLLSQNAPVRAAASNRASRARLAAEVFTPHAGQSRIAGARDVHGNALDGNLAQAGAYAGLKIMVLIYNWEKGNDFSRVRNIALDLGFEMIIYDGASKPPCQLPCWVQPLSSLKSDLLDQQLAECSQCWIISGDYNRGYAHEIILHHWRQGLGLYVLGDNAPFYHDANILLRAMYPDLGVEMQGNYPGQKTLHLHSEAAAGAGYILEDYLTTGIENCYSGFTVAELINTKLIPHFVNVMYETPGHLILGYVPAGMECGPVILSSAFTTFYHGLDTPGSARLIENCIAFLSTRIEPPAAPSTTGEQPEYQLDGALSAECDISYEEGPVAILISPMEGDRQYNCSDINLNNCLARGERNSRVLGRTAYSLATVQLFLQQGNDPVSRRPVVAMLPLVPIKTNYKWLTLTLCNIFMDGLYLPFQAWMNFISACQHMLDVRTSRPEIWNYLLDQCLQNVVSSLDFSEAGVKRPLAEVVQVFYQRVLDDHACNDIYSLSIPHCEVLFKLLLRVQSAAAAEPATSEAPAAPENLDLVRHRIYLRNLFSYFRDAILHNPDLLKVLERSCYDFHLDLIPIYNSGHLSTYYPPNFPPPPATVTPAVLTLLYHAIGTNWSTVIQQSVTHGLWLVVHEKAKIWAVTDTTEVQAVERLNHRFANVCYQPHNIDPVPFATTYGPTSLSCTGCGLSFVPPGLNLLFAPPFELDSIRRNRDAHFLQVYRDRQGRQSSAPYHKTVRTVLRTRYPSALEATPEMLRDCVDGINGTWGNYFRPGLLEFLTALIESYLALRRAGAPETDDATFMVKLLTELGRV